MLLFLSDVRAPSDRTKEISAVVTGLNPYTMYKFRAIGVNVLGEGTPSKPSSELAYKFELYVWWSELNFFYK